MIRNEAEYQIASARLLEERNRLAEHRARLKSTNMSDEEIKRVIVVPGKLVNIVVA